MSTIRLIDDKCFICGEINTYKVIGSTNSFGSPDLDLRPPEMERSTMGLWIRECPVCGYISSRVSNPSTIRKEWLHTEKYLTCNGINFASDLAKGFYKYYLISTEDKEVEEAFFALLHAAWACDDEGDTVKAKICRELAVPLAIEIDKESNDNTENSQVIGLIKADIMRRAGQYDEMIEEYSNITYEDEIMCKVLAFEIEKAKLKDDRCYRVSDAVDEE